MADYCFAMVKILANCKGVIISVGVWVPTQTVGRTQGRYVLVNLGTFRSYEARQYDALIVDVHVE